MAGARGSTGRELVRGVLGRRNRRRGPEDTRRASGRRLVAQALVLGLGILGLLTCWPLIREGVQRHPYFAVREVVVRGNRRLAPDDVRRAAGIEPGISIWDVDCRTAEERLVAEPWLRTARVRRELPGRVVIAVREERPVAILTTTRGAGAPALYYLATRGRVFAPVRAGDPRDFPYVTGLDADDLDGGEAFGPRAVRRALELLRVAARSGPVSEVHVDRTHGLTLLPVRPTVPVEVGWGRFAERLARLPAVMHQWTGREAEIVSVSLEFDDEVIVRTRTAPTKPLAPTRREQRT